MAHRDDLEAALARASALERRVRELETKQVIPSQRLPELDPDEVAALRESESAASQRIEVLEQRLEELLAARRPAVKVYTPAEMERAAQGRPADQAGGGKRLPRVDEHNRSFTRELELDEEAEWMGVACPRCAAAGAEVEMLRGALSQGIGDLTLQQVVCPRCLWADYKAS